MNNDIFGRLRELTATGGNADIITLTSAPAAQEGSVGDMLLITGGRCDAPMIDKAFTQLVLTKMTATEWKKPLLIDVEYTGGLYRLFWDKLCRPKSALVLGAGHVSQPLAGMLAMFGYRVTVVDDRPDFANARRFPQAEQVVCQDFVRALNELNLPSFGVIIIVTRGHRSDLDCLRAVIDQPAAYIGMIGSQGRVRVVMNTLAREGFDQEALARLRAPIGLDIGAETPDEIALSITAEIMAVTRNAGCRPLSDRWRCKQHG